MPTGRALEPVSNDRPRWMVATATSVGHPARRRRGTEPGVSTDSSTVGSFTPQSVAPANVQRFARRHPAATASASVQNQRSPLLSVITVAA